MITIQNQAFLEEKRRAFSRLYPRLNDQQREAVCAAKGPLLVLAGAGSGKTTVLVNRIAGLLSYGIAAESETIPANAAELYPLLKKAETPEEAHKVLLQLAEEVPAPENILCITFTNKAAREFRERLDKLLGEEYAARIWAGTFHSICVRILRRHIQALGYANSFTIYDMDDSKRLIGDLLKRLNIDENYLPVRVALNAISRAKEKGQLPADYAEEIGNNDPRLKKILQVYDAYAKALREANALDFDDIILLTAILFEQNPEILARYQRQFEYILVDEYQDTNPSQSRLVRLFAGEKCNVCVVGDDDQSIYSFRGATVENILSFDRQYPDARVIRLEQNYRSTGNILGAANGIIQHNKSRKGKNLFTEEGDGEKVLLKMQSTQSDEATFVTNYIRTAVTEGEANFRDFAVLYRMNAQSNALEVIFSKNRIPYRVFGGTRFYDRKEIKDILAYLSVISNPGDGVRLRRIINTPRRGIGMNTIAQLETITEDENRTLWEVLRTAGVYPELQKALSKLTRFYQLIDELAGLAAEMPVSDLIREVVERVKYKEFLAEDDPEGNRADNVDELISSAMDYEQNNETPTLSGFLEDVALVSDTDNYDADADAVTMMTIHSAKGLEFPIVFLPGFEEGIFPSKQTMDEGDRAVEEERRLAYVAVTRAKQKLIILHTKTRLLYGRTSSNPVSRFAAEIPEQNKIEDAKPKAPLTPVSDAKRKYADSKQSFIRNVQAAMEEPETPLGGRFATDSRVQHPLFGCGKILSAEKVGPDMLYEIEFDNGDTKRLMGSFARLTPAD